MPSLEDNEEVKLKAEKTIAEKEKLNPQKRKITGTRLKFLAPNKLLTRLLILLAQTKAGSNSNKLKNEIRQILHLLHQHNKTTERIYNNSIKSLWKKICL